MPRALEITGLFAGIGGFELGLSQAGHHTSLLCESDFDASLVLSARFPGVHIVPDVRHIDELRKSISSSSDLLTAGFPCSDLSQAGRMLGFEGEQSSLIRTTLSLLAYRRFPHILLENVPNWRRLHDGRYMQEVIEKLERLNYMWAYRTIDARAFGLPQRRERVFLYATTEGDPRAVLFAGNERAHVTAFPLHERAHGFYWTEGNTGLGWAEDSVPTLKGGSALAIPSPPAILAADGRIVTPHIDDAERLQGFPAKWTEVENPRAAYGAPAFRTRRRWLMVGNAINVGVSTWIGEQLATPQPYSGDRGQPLCIGDKWPSAAWGDGNLRWKADVSAWPVSLSAPPLESFLKHQPAMLSYRAAKGFLSRILASKLRHPPGFLEAVKKHVSTMAAEQAAGQELMRRERPVSPAAEALKRTRKSTIVTDIPTSLRMKGVRQRNTDIELMVRKALSKLGVRFRICNRDLPGSPDIANRSSKWAIFVHGCFWHGHADCPCARLPHRNRAYWTDKINTNRRRDRDKEFELRSLGFEVLTVWGCEAKQLARAAPPRAGTFAKLCAFVTVASKQSKAQLQGTRQPALGAKNVRHHNTH